MNLNMKFTLFWVGIVALTIYSVGAIIYGTMSGVLENLTMQIQASISLVGCTFGAGKFLLHFIEDEKDYQVLAIALLFIFFNILIGGAFMLPIAGILGE